MADFWIKIEKGTPDKPEILELSDILNIEDPDTVTGKLIRVWSWFDSNSENGHAPLVTKVLLDRLTGVTGLTDALVKVGWMIKTDVGYSLPNFDRHLGKGAKKRASDAERKRKSRDKSQECHSKSVTKDETEIGPEKRRVEKIREEIKEPKDLSDKSELVDDQPSLKVDHVIDIFSHWVSVMNKDPSRTRPTEKRIKLIKARLKNYTPDELMLAIDGCKLSPHHQGQNDTGTVYDDLTLIFRSDDHLETFRNKASSKPIAQQNINTISNDFEPPMGWNSDERY